MNGAYNVVVSLNKGYVDVPLRPDNRFDLDRLPEKVRSAGFSAGDIDLTARGTFTSLHGRPAFTVTGRKDLVFLVQPLHKTGAMHWPKPNVPVTLTGVIRQFLKPTGPLTLWVEQIGPGKPATRR